MNPKRNRDDKDDDEDGDFKPATKKHPKKPNMTTGNADILPPPRAAVAPSGASDEAKERVSILSEVYEKILGLAQLAATDVAQELSEVHSNSVYTEAMFLALSNQALLNAAMRIQVQRDLTVPMFFRAHKVGSETADIAITVQGSVMLLLQCKVKRTELKESDLEKMLACREAVSQSNGRPKEEQPPVAVFKFGSSHVSSLIMYGSGDVVAN